MLTCVWFSVVGEYKVPRGLMILTNGKLLIGLGATQLEAEPGSPMLPQHTIGELRRDYDLADELPRHLADDLPCYLYAEDDGHYGDGNNSLTMVLVTSVL